MKNKNAQRKPPLSIPFSCCKAGTIGSRVLGGVNNTWCETIMKGTNLSLSLCYPPLLYIRSWRAGRSRDSADMMGVDRTVTAGRVEESFSLVRSCSSREPWLPAEDCVLARFCRSVRPPPRDGAAATALRACLRVSCVGACERRLCDGVGPMCRPALGQRLCARRAMLWVEVNQWVTARARRRCAGYSASSSRSPRPAGACA